MKSNLQSGGAPEAERQAAMSTVKLTLAIACVVYGAAVIFLAVQVLSYNDDDRFLTLVALTLPWSLLVVIFIWSLIHGASLEFFWFIFLGGGAANAFLFYRYVPKLYAWLQHRAA